jgi:ribonuclease BN (tRNA processing enzyme)
VLIAEASYVGPVPEDSQRYLSSAHDAGRQGTEGGARHLVVTHLLPGTDYAAALTAAHSHYDGHISIPIPGLDLGLD